MQAFLNSKFATVLTLFVVLLAIVVIMKLDAKTPLEWGATAIALLGSVALSIARGLAQPQQTSTITITKKEDEVTKP